jgi:single-stranded DNA-binding protein|tara:strand:+ start:419 stop:709 length:291 start_codon:yes stop_codon:yes gene_type:complete
MTAWTDTVKKTFKEGRLSNPSYQFKDALKDAKKYYKKGEGVIVETATKTEKVVKKVAKKTAKKVSKVARKTKKALKSRLNKRGRKSNKRRSNKNRK